MAKLKDKLWLWGQTAGTHTIFPENIFGLPKQSRMTPLEGCAYLGIPNVCRVVMAGQPKADEFAQEMIALQPLKKVVWSIVGDCDSKGYQDGTNDLDTVLRLAEKNENIVGGVLDDILNVARREVFTPERIKEYADILHQAKRPLQLWSVLYEIELFDWAVPYVQACDVCTFWTWFGKNLPKLEQNIETVRKMFPKQAVYAGIYMWDYGEHKPLSNEIMQSQLECVYRLLKSGEIKGIIFCSNCIADIGLETVEITRQWIKEHGEEDVD